MNRRDLLAGFFWLGIAIFVCIEAIESDFGTFHTPGAGFLPFLSGLLLGLFAIILLLTTVLKKKKMKLTELWKGLEWSKLIWVGISLFLYPILLPTLGYPITTFALMVFLLCMIERKRLWVQGVSAFAIAFASYFIFFYLLDIRFPKGILGF